MSNTTNKKRKQTRKTTPIASLILVSLFAAFGVFAVIVAQEVSQTLILWQNIKNTQLELDQVQTENDYLTSQRDKLQDPNYVENYARGNYLLSKEGETIFYLPSDENKMSE